MCVSVCECIPAHVTDLKKLMQSTPHHRPSLFSLNALTSSFGLMVECLSNFCSRRGFGLIKGNGIPPEKMLESICQHQSNQYQCFVFVFLPANQHLNEFALIFTNAHLNMYSVICIQKA